MKNDLKFNFKWILFCLSIYVFLVFVLNPLSKECAIQNVEKEKEKLEILLKDF